MGQIIKSPASICLSVCDLSYSCSSQSVLMKLCIVVWNTKSKIKFIGGSKSNIPFPYFPQFPPCSPPRYIVNSWCIVNALWFEHHSSERCGQIVAFDKPENASQRPILAIVNNVITPCFLAVKQSGSFCLSGDCKLCVVLTELWYGTWRTHGRNRNIERRWRRRRWRSVLSTRPVSVMLLGTLSTDQSQRSSVSPFGIFSNLITCLASSYMILAMLRIS